jgi:hypothetical protein
VCVYRVSVSFCTGAAMAIITRGMTKLFSPVGFIFCTSGALIATEMDKKTQLYITLSIFL